MVYGDGSHTHYPSALEAGNSYNSALFDVFRVAPTGPAFAPRRWGALACAYLGTPAS